LIRSRVATKELCEGYLKIEKQFNSLPSHKLLVNVVIQLKYQHVDDLLSECAASLQGYSVEATRLSKSINENWDSVIALNTQRVSNANVITQECVTEWESLSFSILKRIASMVSHHTDRVLQAEHITRNYIAEVSHLFSSILGLERIRTAISETEKSIAKIDHEFCVTVFAQTPKWEQELKSLSRKTQLWQRELLISEHKLLKSQVNISAISISQLRSIIDRDFLRPRELARQHIDAVILSLEKRDNLYGRLQRKSKAVRDNSEVKYLCNELSSNENFSSEDRLAFQKFGEILHRDSVNFGSAAHNWRAQLRRRLGVHRAVKNSQLWSLSDFTDRLPSLPPSQLLTNWALGSFDPEIPRLLDTRAQLLSRSIRNTYEPLWTPQPARNPKLNIYWRQLDVLGPIQLVDLLMWRLSMDVWYLHVSLKGELGGSLWAWMPRSQVIRATTSIGLWANHFSALRSDFRLEYSQLLYLNWMRLKVEEKLQRLDSLEGLEIPSAYLAGRFEVINPLSQDAPRFRQWVDRMSYTAQDAHLYTIAANTKDESFWENLYDKLESVQRTPSLALELELGSVMVKKMSESPAIVSKKNDPTSEISNPKYLAAVPDMEKGRPKSLEDNPQFLDAIRNTWLEYNPSRVGQCASLDLEPRLSPDHSTSGQGSQSDQGSPLDIQQPEYQSQKTLIKIWKHFKSVALRTWDKKQERPKGRYKRAHLLEKKEPQLGNDLTLLGPERKPKIDWMLPILEKRVLRETAKISTIDWPRIPALASWAEPSSRLRLQSERGPRPALTHRDWYSGFETLTRCTSSSWAADKHDSNNLPLCTEILYNDWLDFQHSTLELWSTSHAELPEGEVVGFMKAWATRKVGLYRTASESKQRAQRRGRVPSELPFKPSDGTKESKITEIRKDADQSVKQLSQEEHQVNQGPSPKPSNQRPERNRAESELIKPHVDGSPSTIPRMKPKPHQMARRVQSILADDFHHHSADILPARTKDRPKVDTSPKVAGKKSLTSDQAFENLFATPKHRLLEEVRNTPPGVNYQGKSHIKRKGGSIPSMKSPRVQSSGYTLGIKRIKSKRVYSRKYSTDASCYGVNQQTRDVNHDSLSEPPLEDEMPSATSANTQPARAELVSCLDTDSGANDSTPLFWSHSSQQSPDGQKLIVHYCRTLRSTEETVQLFLGSKVLGFDMEWKSSASSWDSIQNNVSLIQIANEERIALFHIALFKPARTLADLVSPSLKRLIESPDVTKVGVSIKADCTRLRKHLAIDAKATFELSHLFKLIKHGKDNPKLVNKRGVNLSDQMEEHFGLPLDKSEDVRCGDWARALNYRQVQCEWCLASNPPNEC
jgi:hypothetical protein